MTEFYSARLPNAWLTESHEAWRTQQRHFISREIESYADGREESGKVPDEIWPKAAPIGLFAVGYPEAYGGISEDIYLWHLNILHGKLARLGVRGVTAALTVHAIFLPCALKYGNEAVRHEVEDAVLIGQKRITLDMTEPTVATQRSCETLPFDNTMYDMKLITTIQLRQ